MTADWATGNRQIMVLAAEQPTARPTQEPTTADGRTSSVPQNPDRGAVPAWPNRFATMAWPGWLTYDPVALAARVRQPTLLVHSEQAAIPAGAHRFADALTATKTVEWSDGTQFDFYDGDIHVDRAVDLAATHFGAHL